MNRKKVATIIIITTFAILIFTCLITIFIIPREKQNKFESYMNIGDKYLDELNYQDAIMSYTNALNIMPSSNDAIESITSSYLSWADDLIANENYTEAKQILEDAKAIVANNAIENKINEINTIIDNKKLA